MSINYAPCFYRIDFVVIPSYIELSCSEQGFSMGTAMEYWAEMR